MSKERPNWDEVIEKVEDEYKQHLWEKFGTSGLRKNEFIISDTPLTPESEDVLDEIAFENERTNPDGEMNYDQEEIWRVTGKYIYTSRKK